jgi:syntaxin-binding protein 5
MAHLLRGKQAGISNDLSAGLTPELFTLDDLVRYGINSQVSALTYDPVQSLLAVGTRNSQYGPGQIYIFGRNRVQLVLPLPARGAAVKTLQFCADKLVCLDSKHELSLYSILSQELLSSHTIYGTVTSLTTDPTLDYAFIGIQTGDVLAYDLDRENLAPFKIPNQWTQMDPRAKATPVVSLQLHPRDVGTLLIGYAHGAAIYSFKLAKALKFYLYEIPPGAPGGDGDMKQTNIVRRPRLTQATWHPTGTFVMTGYEDSSIVFWDVNKDGRMLQARTRTDTDITSPGPAPTFESSLMGTTSVKEPLFKVAWCASGQDPDDTGLLIAGGASTQTPTKGLCFLEFGRTPVYNTSSWEVLAGHLRDPKRSRILPTPPGAEVIDFCLIPRSSPHFNNAHDPIAIIALLASGELLTLSFPSGMFISPTNQLHPSLTFVHPYIKKIGVATMDRTRWLGMTETRQSGPPILRGGVDGASTMKRLETRNIIHTAHADGAVRLWDVGNGDEIENDKVLQVDVARAVGRFDNVDITQISLAGASSEMAVGLRSGELVVFRWARNKNAGREPPSHPRNAPRSLNNVTERVEPSLTEGLLPFTLLDQQAGPVTTVKMSEVGFVAAGFENGSIAVIDLRGPAVIHTSVVTEFNRGEKRSAFRKTSNNESPQPDWATCMEFSVMTLEGEEWSSILLHVGTHQGHLGTFKVVPDPSGRYTVQFAGSINMDSRVSQIFPISVDTGLTAVATQTAVASLRSGARTNGAIIAVAPTSVHIARPATSKGAHKSFDSFFCDAAGLIRYHDRGQALLTLSGDGYARVYSVPGLKELAPPMPLSATLDVRRFAEARITPTGHIIAFTGPSELAVLSVFGSGQSLTTPLGLCLFNPEAVIPPRPTISNLQWVTGTQVSSDDIPARNLPLSSSSHRQTSTPSPSTPSL